MLTAFLLIAAMQAAQAPAPVPLDYDAKRPVDVEPLTPADRHGVVVRQITYEQLDGTRNAATLVLPAANSTAPHPAILYLHWYEPPKPSSNRTEFLPEAVELASLGTASLLVDTPWRAEGWFAARDSSRDYDFSVQQAKEVRRALDVLLSQAAIDPARVAIVGHDFGAMYGALAAAADRRVTHLVYMAGSGSMGGWFLFEPKREGNDREAFLAKLRPLDPELALARFSPRPALLQFGTKDRFVSNQDAKAQAEAVKGAGTVKMYEGAEHELTYTAARDRIAWLKEQFRLQ
ncbi:MAG TPA: alpha/beta fold hydrolase [Vicinamibacterales bacterium]|jgi:cephalosporin-C deacetylase-like acetyl esterase|nr:alpha/beta fold hydrolase [Vicinamibacterales bacterium]